ncbi:hypothetical protein [Paeniglutamicibacter terrestris]|uniref:Uncharacterized protein n=1 Tax=Paeniglutamicibacter terrestris TaxID=2723403 RepID=A0ABX1G9A9_9MICC|nr:hypothetical protein [Paeniglutamicibacter terrestris]NKG22230.1 hypothetical protein [Paeniglutamicibacter terrestris]
MIHKQQAEVLAALLALMRPGNWRPNQTLSLFAEHRDDPHPFPVIAEAAIRAANDPAIKSPSGIFLPGKHWQFETFKVEPPKADPCPDHEWEAAHHCRACLADVLVGERRSDQVGKGKPKLCKPQPPPKGWRQAETVPSPSEARTKPYSEAIGFIP